MISVGYYWFGSNVKCWSLSITNASRGTVNARRFQSHWAAVVAVVVFEFGVMRCQPLRRALVSIWKNHQKLRFNILKNQLLASVQVAQFGFWVSGWCCFGRKCWKFSSFKIAASSLWSGFLCRGLLTVANLTLIVLSFNSLLHSFRCWMCACLMHSRKMTFKKIC
jgi:hypothetical protein